MKYLVEIPDNVVKNHLEGMTKRKFETCIQHSIAEHLKESDICNTNYYDAVKVMEVKND